MIFILKRGGDVAKRLTDRQKKKIVADYLELQSYNATAKENGVSKDTVKRVVLNCEEFAQKAQQKKEQNTADMLEFMDSRKEVAQVRSTCWRKRS